MKTPVSSSALLIAMLAFASLACNAVTSAFATPGASSSSANLLLRDDFSNSSSGWGTGTDADSSVEYVGRGLDMTLYKASYFVYSNPNDKTYQNVHIDVTIENNSTEEIATFGVMCDQQSASDAYYYFGISPNGEYAISKAEIGKEDTVMTNNGEWLASDLIPKNAGSYKLGADCGNGTLTLYVEGKKVDSVQDGTYSQGMVGVFAWSAKEQSGTSVVFHDFVMTEAK